MRIFKNISESIGRTPLLDISGLFDADNVESCTD